MYRLEFSYNCLACYTVKSSFISVVTGATEWSGDEGVLPGTHTGPESELSNSIVVCTEINRAQKDYHLKWEALLRLPVVPFPV